MGKWYSTTEVPFDRALRVYKEAHAAYLAALLSNGAARSADVRAFEDLADARRREGRPWSPEDYK